MTSVKRSHRVGGLIQKELSVLLLTKIKDPRLDLVTITRVNMTDDLRSARIHFSVVAGQERSQKALAGFKSALGFMRRELGRRLGLRYIPELRFVYDESFDRAATLNEIFRAIHDETDSTVDKASQT